MKRIILKRLQPKFCNLIRVYLDSHNRMSQKELANLVGIQEPHLSALMIKVSDKNEYKRKLSAHYLLKFIIKGVITVAQIKDQDEYQQATEGKEKDFWELAKLMENTPLMKKLHQAQTLGLDIETFLDAWIAAKKS